MRISTPPAVAPGALTQPLLGGVTAMNLPSPGGGQIPSATPIQDDWLPLIAIW